MSSGISRSAGEHATVATFRGEIVGVAVRQGVLLDLVW
jgi:hypothetical protein